jgi:hypothetical protein|tara:strand:+ start:208 stop:444 length:237 start_codon:yes stop_codon:yes gene_type:complete
MGQHIFTTRKTAAYVAILAGCSPKTVRKFADLGKIDCQRNHCGWRIFDDPEKVAQEVQQLLGGKSEKFADQKDNGSGS